MSTPSKAILGLCAVGFAAWFVMVVEPNVIPPQAGFFLWITAVWIPPLFFLILASVLVLAMTDLVRFPAFRTLVNFGVAVVGLIGLILGAWRWYVEMFTPSRGPAL